MSGPALHNNWDMLRPQRRRQIDHNFLAIGDGSGPNQATTPAKVVVIDSPMPFYRASAIAQNKLTKQVVIATEDPENAFVVTDERASNWQVSNAIFDWRGRPFQGFCKRLHYIQHWDRFFGQVDPSATHAALFGFADGVNWQAYDGGTLSEPTGFAFSDALDRGVSMTMAGEVLVISRGPYFSLGYVDAGGYSVVWYAPLNRFLAYRPGTQVPIQSDNGQVWLDYDFNLPVPCGTAAGPFSLYTIKLQNNATRLLLFTTGGTAPAWYSDDHGQTWDACLGIENTGPVSRYVAVDGNAVYVAYDAELNKGMISRDYGQTWERSDHLSGNARGVTALT